MRLFKSPKRKESIYTLPNALSSSITPDPRQGQEGTLALPTKLDEVANAVHECVPQQLPGEQASQDDVRYFLYQVLTLKDYNLARKSPQWVLETCMLWQGGGNKLRALPLDEFQQLCPLRPGYAFINWNVRSSKFRQQDMPPCGVRDEIGYRVKNIVEYLKRREQGNFGPGWRNTDQSKPATTSPVATDMVQTPNYSGVHEFQTSLLGATPFLPAQNHFYGLENHSMPLLHQILPPNTQQYTANLRRQPGSSISQYEPQESAPLQRVITPAAKDAPTLNLNTCVPGSPVLCSGSPTSSYHQDGSFSSRHTNSTAQTSPIGSESEDQICRSKTERSTSVATLTANSLCASSDSGRQSRRQPLTTKPSRYKGNIPSRPTHLHNRTFHPAHHLAHLRSQSYDSSSLYAHSETSLTPSDSVTHNYGYRHDSVMPLDTPQQTGCHSTLHPPSIASSFSVSSTPQSYVTALPYPKGSDLSRVSTVLPVVNDRSNLLRPINNYKVDAHALGSAELLGHKSMPGPVRSMMAEEERRRKLTRGHSDGGLNLRMNNFPSDAKKDERPVGPLLRFHNPRTGQPRLTIYETIEQQGMLGKQHLEDQRRVEMQQGRLKTVFETIEEQELLDGKPQRGMDTYAGRDWSTYL